MKVQLNQHTVISSDKIGSLHNIIKSAENELDSKVKSHLKSRAKLKEKEETEASILEEATKNLQSLKDVKNSTKLEIDKMEKTHAAALKLI